MDLCVIKRHEGHKMIGHKSYQFEVVKETEKNLKPTFLEHIKRSQRLGDNETEEEAKQCDNRSEEIKSIPKGLPDSPIQKFAWKETEDNELTEVTDTGPVKEQVKLNPELLEGFTVLGTDSFQRKKYVKRVLPDWLAKPTIISSNLQSLNVKVTDIKQLDKCLRKLLKANGIKYFFPVQVEVIPWLLKANEHKDIMFPRDICVSAPTGSGKTLSFVLPVIQALKKYAIKRIRALVILPTQDLAMQVYKTFRMYSQNSNVEVCLITGINSFALEQSQLCHKNRAFGVIHKVDILVCTAGRLVDHLKLTEGFDLRHLEFLIVDEADRVLEYVQNDWLYHLEKHIQDDKESGKTLNLFALQKRRPPQKLLFSATLSQDPEKLNKLSLFQPKLFTSVPPSDRQRQAGQPTSGTFIGRYTTPNELTEKYIVTSLNLKPLCLYRFIKNEKLTRTMVFTHSAESTHRLAIVLSALLKDDLKVVEISAQLQGKSRSHLIEKFSNNSINILVCTDSLARGIDLPHVQCVISYSAPKHLKTYIHRVGRTARAGEQGLAVTLVDKQQVSRFKEMITQAGKTNIQEVIMQEKDLETLGEQYQQSLQELKIIVEEEERLDLEKTLLAKGKRLRRKRKHSEPDNISKIIDM